MDKTVITEDRTEFLFIDQKGSWVIAENASIKTTDESAIWMTNGADYARLTVRGDLEATGQSAAGISARDDFMHVNVTQTGSLKGYYGIEGTYLADLTLHNSGKISGSQYGLSFYGVEGMEASNDGRIAGSQAGVQIDGNDIDFVNRGTIKGNLNGVILRADQFATVTFTNHGTVDAPSSAFVGGKYNEIVINHGKLDGDVSLGDGYDTFNFGSGKVTGAVYGGGGGDTFIIRSKAASIFEFAGEGNDTIKSFVSHTLEANVEKLMLAGGKDTKGIGNAGSNVIDAKGGDNVLNGMEGSDYLNGGTGDDRLIGGAGKDYFLFGPNSGRDVVKDFEVTGAEHDIIDLYLLDGFDDFADIAPLMKQVGDDVRIDFGGGNRVLIENVELGELDADHFVF